MAFNGLLKITGNLLAPEDAAFPATRNHRCFSQRHLWLVDWQCHNCHSLGAFANGDHQLRVRQRGGFSPGNFRVGPPKVERLEAENDGEMCNWCFLFQKGGVMLCSSGVIMSKIP